MEPTSLRGALAAETDATSAAISAGGPTGSTTAVPAWHTEPQVHGPE